MKLKLTLAFVFLLLALQVVVAAPVQVDAPNNVTTVRGVDKTITLEVTNPNNITLYNVKVAKTTDNFVVSSDVISSLEFNDTAILSFVINAPSVADTSKTYTIETFRKINCSEITTPQITEIRVDRNGVVGAVPIGSPQQYSMCGGGRVKFKNVDTISINVQFPSSLVSISLGNGGNIAAGGEAEAVLSTLGSYTFSVNTQIRGTVVVDNILQDVHSVENDGSITMLVHSILDPTTITTAIDDTSFNVSYDDASQSTVLRITNTGSKTAENVRFESIAGNWMSFEPSSSQSIAAGTTKLYIVHVIPIINSASDTNKTYTKQITIAGDNIETKVIDISVFVPYANIASGNLSSAEWWIARKAYCDAHPTAPDCVTEPIIVYRDVPIYDCPPILANISATDVKAALDNYFSLKGDIGSLGTNLKLDSDTVKTALVELAASYNLTVTDSQKNTEVLESINGTALVVAGLVVFVIIMGVAGFVMYKKYESKKKAAALRY